LSGTPPAVVTLTLVHGFERPMQSGKFVEVVEFGWNGCAMTRTMMSGEAWNLIMNLAAQPGFDI
jgi:hypothetical protein